MLPPGAKLGPDSAGWHVIGTEGEIRVSAQSVGPGSVMLFSKQHPGDFKLSAALTVSFFFSLFLENMHCCDLSVFGLCHAPVRYFLLLCKRGFVFVL